MWKVGQLEDRLENLGYSDNNDDREKQADQERGKEENNPDFSID